MTFKILQNKCISVKLCETCLSAYNCIKCWETNIEVHNIITVTLLYITENIILYERVAHARPVHCGSGVWNMAASIVARCVRSLNYRLLYINRLNTAVTLTAAPFSHGRAFSHLSNGHKSSLAQVSERKWPMTSNDLPVSLLNTTFLISKEPYFMRVTLFQFLFYTKSINVNYITCRTVHLKLRVDIC